MEGGDAVNLPSGDADDVIVIIDDDDGDDNITDPPSVIHGSVDANGNLMVTNREVPDKDMPNDEDTKEDIPVVISDDDDDVTMVQRKEESIGPQCQSNPASAESQCRE